VPAACAEDVSAWAYELGSCGLQAEEAGEWTQLSAYFAAEPARDLTGIRRELTHRLAALGLASPIGTECVEEQDWEAEWRRFFAPVWATERIVVHPSWIPVELAEDQIAVRIDPKMAFGTGGHESTQLCLQALERCLRPGMRCLDLGTGSGILSIAAALLGAGPVLAVDIDEQAVANARENLEHNRIGSEQVEVRLGGVEAVAERPFDLVLANIQSHVLRPLLTPLRSLLTADGRIAFSGLLAREAAAFCRWVTEAKLEVDTILAKGAWICVVVRNSGGQFD
jgi:ribosomal protein L11 methyltransferase